MKAAVFHGYGSSPTRIKWLVTAFKEVVEEVVVPTLPSVLVKAWEATKGLEADMYGGHSMGGALALLHSAFKGRPAVAVAPPTDLRKQLAHLRDKFPKIYKDITSQVDEETMVELSPINMKFTAPVLLIHGTEDKVVPLEQSLSFCERVKVCHLVVVDGMGHKPVTDSEKEIVRRHIVEFLNSLS